MQYLNKKLIGMMTAITLITGIGIPMFSSPALSLNRTQWCWCTDYVASRFGLNTSNMPAANKWDNGYLKNNGFRQTTSPQDGDIVVMEAGFPWADASRGHVGVFRGMDKNGFILVRGGNNGGKPKDQVTEFFCNNVTEIWYKGADVRKSKLISFWTRR